MTQLEFVRTPEVLDQSCEDVGQVLLQVATSRRVFVEEVSVGVDIIYIVS